MKHWRPMISMAVALFRNIEIAGNQLTVTTTPLKNPISAQEIVVTAIFDRAE